MPSCLSGAFRRDLVAHQTDVLGAGADEIDVVLGENFGKAGVLGEEAVARMHGVGAGDLACRKQRRNVEIAVAGGRWTDADALIGEPHVHGVSVGGRVHRYRRNTELLARAQHAQSDLSPVGNQDLIEHAAAAWRKQRPALLAADWPTLFAAHPSPFARRFTR